MVLDLPGHTGGGTGFVIAPGTVVTCAHVVAGAEAVRGRIIATGGDLVLSASGEDFHRAGNGLDVAFLRYAIGEAVPAPQPVLTSPNTSLGDRMWAYGHPRGDYRAGQWAALEYQGDSRLSFDDPMPMPRGYGTPVGEGFSGSPVVNHRTGAVCGMLARSNKAGSAHMVPLAEILDRCSVTEAPAAWLAMLTDEQVRAGGFRYPGSLLRDYLVAARDGADEHPYAMLLTDAGDVPLSTVYVRQEASQFRDLADTGRSGQSAVEDRPAAESVLSLSRHVLFTGGAGSGKSSLLRRLTFAAAGAWLEQPSRAPSYLPVRVAADDLGDRPLPEALASAVGRDLLGLRRSLPPELFESGPMPSVDWLVCVDSLDEVLDPEQRGKVIRLIQRWAREPHMRFVVASRSLVTAEMHRLDALRRYSLLELGDQEIGKVARAWFEAMGVSDPGQRAAVLTSALRHGRLSEVARNPLYLTMICVVAAVRDLPRDPAKLYARFIDILREKGSQRLLRGDQAAVGITSQLLNRVHEALAPVAEKRQGGDARPLLEQVIEALPTSVADRPCTEDMVFRALTFTGLVRQRGGDLHFLHHTIQEYLAGCAIAGRLTPKDPEALTILRDAIAAERPNVILFLAASWREQGMPLREFLQTAVTAGGWRDLLLCATILSDELVTDGELTARFTWAVIKLYGRNISVGDLRVETVLDRLYAVLRPQDLVAVVRDPTVPHRPRVDALTHYVRRECEQAAVLATWLADEGGLPASSRVVAARLLAHTGERGMACRRLADIARDTDNLPATRFEAAMALMDADPTAGTPLLGDLLSSTDFPENHVESVLRSLPDTVDMVTRCTLTDALARNPALTGVDTHTLEYLVCGLLAPGRPEAVEELCRNAAMPLHLRHKATWWLPADGESTSADAVKEALFSQMLDDPRLAGVSDLALNHCRDASLVERVARNERLPHYSRITALTRLIGLGRHAVVQECADDLLASCEPRQIIAAAAVFNVLGEPSRSRQVLGELLDDAELSGEDRLNCIRSLIEVGASDRTEAVCAWLSRMAEDAATAAAERLEAVECLFDLNPTDAADLLARLASDDALPGEVRHDAATQLLKNGRREPASRLLRRIAEDSLSGMSRRINALTDLAEVDMRAASETLHRILDDPGLLDQHLWALLELADALVPDTSLRRRLDTLLDEEGIAPAALLRATATQPHRTSGAAPLRRALSRMMDDPALEPRTRATAVARSVGLIPYPRWKALMAGLDPDALRCLSLHLQTARMSSIVSYPDVWKDLTFAHSDEGIETPTGALAGLDPRVAVARWGEFVARREVVAVTELRPLIQLMNNGPGRDRVAQLLREWVEDPEAPLEERAAAAATAGRAFPESWYALAADDETPPELRVMLCDFLPSDGASSRVPLVRALAADPAFPVQVRARAAVFVTQDLGEVGHAVLRELSGPNTADSKAHLAAAAAWEELDVGGEAVAAYRRVLDGEGTAAGHRVAAAKVLVKWRSVRRVVVRALKELLREGGMPLSVRLDAAEVLIGSGETAEAHVGLLRLARAARLGAEERRRLLDLLPADFHACVRAASE
ncbi:trypsin-like peptidase domain-containing protein [Streptomyces sp. NPDC001046]|uniref:trypsin-like peptidase domain-containing protein n=1 Tax=Streptomyces sp. NPDC001046 TaxID=3364543 RepID=UPI00369615CD